MASSMLITSAGLREVVNAEHDGTAPIKLTHIAFGTGKYVPSAERTSLEAEFKRFDAISGGAVGDNVLHVSARDASSEAYIVHEIGLFTESGTLFAVCSDELPLIQKSARSQALLSIDMAVVGFSAESIVLGDTNFLNPPATTTTAGVVYLASDSDIEEGTSISKVVTAKALKNAIGNAKSGAVLYESEQALGDPQKAQARKNIDAVSSKELADGLTAKQAVGDYPTRSEMNEAINGVSSTGAVRYDQVQGLGARLKEQARQNIGAASVEDLSRKQDAGDYPTRSEMNQAIGKVNAIPKNGDRGFLAGYESIKALDIQTISNTSSDSLIVNSALRIELRDGEVGQAWQKNVLILATGATIQAGSMWKWVGGKVQPLKVNSLLVCKWAGYIGFLDLIVAE